MMESPSLSAPKELRIEVPPSTLPQLDTQAELPAVEAAQLSPKIDRVRHHLIPARTTTCVRAPCLKRQVSVPVSSIANDLAGNRLEAALVHDRIASNPLPTSFTAPRNLILQAGSRHVHFDDAPPEEFFVLSGESYDRRPIKCTQGGSEFDMSLPPRSSSYNGDDVTDEDAPAPDDASAVMGLAEEPAPDVGFFGDPLLENWACIKNGTGTVSVGYQPRQQHSGLMASGRSLHFSALSSLQHASALNATTDAVPSNLGTQSQSQQPHPQVDSQKVSLPVHGFRSFGGLQNSLAPELTAVAAAAKPTASPKQVPPSPETTPPAVRHLSPDATPMPSPSLHKSMGAYSSVSYFDADSTFSQPAVPADSADSVCNEESLSSNDAVLASENILGAMEVLRDGQAPILSETSERFRIAQPFRVSEPAQTASGLSSPSSVKPASITIKVPDTSTQSTPRRVGLERRVAEKDAVRLSGLHPVVPIGGAAAASSPGWPSVLGITSSPLSSRCSSVDPWSSLSSDGDGDGTESPGNENSWISSNCTSPDLSPFEQIAEGLNHKAGPQFASSFGVTRPEASNPKHVDIAAAQPGPGFKPEQVSTGTDDSEHELTTPKTSDFADDAKFSSSVETVNTVSWEHKHMTTVSSASLFSCLSSADVSTTASEATTPDSSRRPSFQHADQASRHLSPRLRSGFGAREGSAIDTLDEDESHVLRVRSLSRDGHAKKKSPRCRFCRALRQRIRGSCTDSSAPASFGGSAQSMDVGGEVQGDNQGSCSASEVAPQPADAPTHHRDLTGAHDVPELDGEGARSRSSLSQLRASVRSLSMDDWAFNKSRSRSRESSTLSHPGIAQEAQHDRESSNSPGESCSESPHLFAVNLPTMCTCDKKREKERLKKKIRKEREMERERDREWERDQARGRQKKLFGESFGDADNSCLSALDGF